LYSREYLYAISQYIYIYIYIYICRSVIIQLLGWASNTVWQPSNKPSHISQACEPCALVIGTLHASLRTHAVSIPTTFRVLLKVTAVFQIRNKTCNFVSKSVQKTTRGVEPISYRGVLLSTLLHATVYVVLHSWLNVLVQIANKMGLQKIFT
jgi:hypothetical protein